MSTIDLNGLSANEKRRLLTERLLRPPRVREFPLSFSQQRLWFLEQLVPGSAAYNVPTAVRIHGPLDLGVWRRSCDEIVRRHAALRTTFAEVGGRPVQRVAETGGPTSRWSTAPTCPATTASGRSSGWRASRPSGPSRWATVSSCG